jgi:tetratricopeptide (TPR) repeat protein
MSPDHDLLFGILALQHNLITNDQLLGGLQQWVREPSHSLGAVLESSGALSSQNRQLLEPLVNRQLAEQSCDKHSLGAGAAAVLQSTEGWERIGDDTEAVAADSVAVGLSTSSGRFRLLRFHAAGGLGQVSIARDSELHRDVALKEIKPEYAARAQARQQFLLEAEITGGLEHPSIVPVYGLGVCEDGRPFYAMRFIKGETLEQAIDRYHRRDEATPANASARTLALRGLLGRFVDACQAVEYAHSRGVLHRDLKPANVMLGDYGETLVVDWGLAKILSSNDGATAADGDGRQEIGARVGTLRYMSPEQAAGEVDKLGPATDVFALGATLYHLLTGQAMYTAATKEELLRKVAAADFVPPRSLRDDIPRPLEAICLRAVAASPSSRYSSARALLEDIESFLADEPVAAYREPIVARARRWARKRPGLVSGTLATAAVTLVALTVGTVVLGQKNSQLAQANASEKNQRERAERGEKTALLNEQKARQQERIAKQNEAKAREEEAIATAVKNFLLNDLLALAEPDMQAGAGIQVDPELKVQDLFRRASKRLHEQFPPESPVAVALDPLVSQSVPSELTVRDFTLRASDKIDGRFQKQPQVEHDVRLAIALAQRAVGEFARSIVHLERCRALVVELRGSEDPATFSSMNNLAVGYQIAGRSSEAVPLLEETLRLRKTHLGPHHPETLSSLNNLANTFREVGRLKEALPLLKEALALRREHLGPDHEDTISSMENLASGYLKADQLREAVPLYVNVLEQREAKLGADHPDTLRAVVNLAMAYRLVGRFPAAVAMLEGGVKRMQSQLGADHPTTLSAMISLANAYQDVGRTAAATPLFESVLELRQKKLGPEHPLTLNSMRSLGIVYRRTNRPADALPLFEKALAVRLKQQGKENPDTLVEMSKVGDALADLGRAEEAIPLYQEALEQLRTVVGPEHAYTLLVTSNLAIEYRNAGRLADALPLLERVLEAKQKKQGLEHPDTVRTLGSLAITETKLEKWSAAEQHFLSAWEAMESFPPELRTQFRGGLGPEIVAMYEAWGKSEEAAVWQRKLAALGGE